MGTKKIILVPMGTKVPKWGLTWEQCIYCTPPPHDFLSSPAGREIADSRHVFQNSVKSFMRVLSCNIVIMMGNYHF